jgi:CAAX prenyl protease-like protein
LTSSVLFGLEHSRWLAGVLAGLAYGLLYIRTGDLWAAVAAHITTNYLLGLYVLATGAYVFW